MIYRILSANLRSMSALALTLATLMLGFASPAQASETKEFFVDGLKVIHRSSPKDVISVRLVVKGGTVNYAKEKEGVESLSFSLAMQGGTKDMDKIAFNTAAEQIGASYYSSANLDYGDLGMTCIKMFWDKSWDLFAKAITAPAFNETEFNLMREQFVAQAKSAEQDPDTYLRYMATQNAFAGTSYEKIPAGTPASLEQLSVSDVKNYFASVVGKKNCFLVVVGNVDQKDLKAKISATLANLPMGKVSVPESRKLITEDAFHVVERNIETNYIRGVMSAPRQDHPDAVPMRLAMSILRDRYFEELRTKRSLTYAPGAFYSSGVLGNPYNVLYVSTQKPKESMEVMVDELNKIKKDGFGADELVNQQQTFLTYNFMGLETVASQSNNLAMAELAGEWELADEFTDKVNATSLKDLNRVFDTYTNAIVWTYLGLQDQVDDGDFKQPVEIPKANKPY